MLMKVCPSIMTLNTTMDVLLNLNALEHLVLWQEMSRLLVSFASRAVCGEHQVIRDAKERVDRLL